MRKKKVIAMLSLCLAAVMSVSAPGETLYAASIEENTVQNEVTKTSDESQNMQEEEVSLPDSESMETIDAETDDVEAVYEDGIEKDEEAIESEEKLEAEAPDAEPVLEEPSEAEETEQEAQTIAEETAAEEDNSTGTYSGVCDTGVQWKLENGIMTFSGEGEIPYFMNVGKQPWADIRDEIKEIIIEDGITYVGYYAFAECSELETVTVADSVTGINDHVFYQCTSLKNVDLGHGITYLGANVFGYSGIEDITLPKSLIDFSEYTFLYTENLENIYVEKGNPTLSSQNGILFSADRTEVICYPSARTGAYSIPSEVKKIAAEAFSQSQISDVTIPDSVTEIGDTAFHGCNNIQAIVFPKSLKKIPYWTCLDCESLTSVTIPEGITEIEWEAFSDCDNLTQVTIPATVIKIGRHAFPDTTKLILKNHLLEDQGNGCYMQVAKVKVGAYLNYSKAFQVLKLVNQERAKVGAKALVMDSDLLKAAMMRSTECALNYSHTRPNGEDCGTVSTRIFGENLAIWSETASSVMNMWMNSEWHRANILSGGYTSIGIGCAKVDGMYYWVQCFGIDSLSEASLSSYYNKNKEYTISVVADVKYYRPTIKVTSTSIMKGNTANVKVTWNNGRTNVTLSPKALTMKSANTSIFTVSKSGTITAKKTGKAKLTIYFPGYKEAAVTKTITVKKNTIKKASIKKVTNVKGEKISVTLKKLSGIRGYQIAYATDSKFTQNKKTKTTTKTSKTLTNLKKGKTYYIKVRAYKVNSSGKKLYGPYSKAKKVKIRK